MQADRGAEEKCSTMIVWPSVRYAVSGAGRVLLGFPAPAPLPVHSPDGSR